MTPIEPLPKTLFSFNVCFKAVLGKNRKDKLDFVREFLKQEIDPLLGSQQKMIDSILNHSKRCRLLYPVQNKPSEPAGIFVYDKTPASPSEVIKIEVFQTLGTNLDQETKTAYANFMINEIYNLIENDKHTLNPLLVQVPTSDEFLKNFFKKQGFEKQENSTSSSFESFISKSLHQTVEDSNKKRKATSSFEIFTKALSKKQRTLSLTSLKEKEAPLSKP